MSRQLQLFQKDNFFSDPFFTDINSAFADDDAWNRRLTEFRDRCGGPSNTVSILADNDKSSREPHNLQVTVSKDKYAVQLELPGFEPEDFELKSRGDATLVLQAVHADKSGQDEETQRSYTKEFDLPEGVQVDKIKSTYSAEGILSIEAPRLVELPKGTEYDEAMAAKSQAYTTDDGKTAVKEKSSKSMQKIATTTQSADGTQKSTMSYSSSSSTSSSMVTSSTLGGGQMPQSIMTQMPAMGFGSSSTDMDAMMSQMMADMPSIGSDGNNSFGGNMTNISSKMSSTKSSSSTSSSKMTSSNMLTGGLDSNFMMPKLDIEELSNAGSDLMAGSGNPTYSVTSPPPPPSTKTATSLGSKSHQVQGSESFASHQQSKSSKGSDSTVLMKCVDGPEFKLVLNMRMYKPENIAVKLHGNTQLSITAQDEASGDQFGQKHTLPDGLDLDKLMSTFSADGLLVIKAPKK